MYVIRNLGHQTRLSIGDHDSILRLFGQVHNHIYANEGLSPTEALEEFVKVLFTKLTDERENQATPKFTIFESERIAIQQKKPNHFRERIENLFESCKAKNPDIFSGNERLGLKDGTLAFVVGMLKDVTLLNSDHDIKAKWYKKSNVELTKELVRYSEWKEKDMAKRAEDLANRAVDIWTRP